MIGSFTGKYSYLSNFYLAEIEMDGELYPSTEHAFQAAKTSDPNSRSAIRNCGYAGITEHLDLREKLLETDNRQLVEGNWHGDTFWGACGGKGQNHLGKILMEVREELRA